MDASQLLLNDKAKSPRNEFVHYTSRGDLEGIRQGKWKLLVKKKRQQRRGKNKGKAKANQAPPAPEVLLFDLKADLSEQRNLASANPDIVKKLQARMTELDAEIEANARAPWMKP
jgi:arylsulfatase A-like enzyme